MGGANPHNQEAPADERKRLEDQFRRIRFADSVRVAGEACVVTLAIRGIHTAEARSALERLRPALRREIDIETAKISGLGTGQAGVDYRVDDIEWVEAGQVSSVVITVYGMVTKDQRSARVRLSSSRSSSGGELWVNSIDYFQDSVRKRIAKALSNELGDVRVTPSWVPGSGILVSGGGIGDTETPSRLEEELWARRGQARALKARKNNYFQLALGCVSLVLVAAVVIPRNLAGDFAFGAGVVAFYLLIGAIAAGWVSFQAWGEQREMREEIQDLVDRIDLGGYPNDKEKRAYKLFKLNGQELKRYYDQALWQRSFVFALGVACILAGFASIAWALIIIQGLGAGGNLNDKIIVAVLGGTGAILADFIAVIFLRMFSHIVKSTVEFHLRLVGTHHAHFGNVLASRIEDDPAVANKTLSDLAVTLVSRGGTGFSTEDPPSDVEL